MTLWGAPDKRAHIQAFRLTVFMKNEQKQRKGWKKAFCLFEKRIFFFLSPWESCNSNLQSWLSGWKWQEISNTRHTPFKRPLYTPRYIRSIPVFYCTLGSAHACPACSEPCVNFSAFSHWLGGYNMPIYSMYWISYYYPAWGLYMIT